MLNTLRQIYSRALAQQPIHKAELLSVQRMRGLAVLMVLVVHIEDIAMRLPGWPHSHSSYAQYIGYSAPDMFFVISGFIMSYITFSSPFKPRQWLISRFIRIYPMYIIFTLLVVALWLNNPAHTMGSGAQTPWSILKSLLILPQANLPLLFVGWTVEHEIVFYTVVFLTACFLGSQWLLRILWLLSALAIARWCYQNATGTQIWDLHITSLYMIQFAMGASIYKYWISHPANPTLMPALLGLGLLIIGALYAHSGFINQEQPLRVIAFGGAYSCLLLVLLNRERKQKAAGQYAARRDALVWLGDASYSVYLCHPFVLAIAGKIFPHIDASPAMCVVYLVLTGVITLLVGFLTHLLLEKPIIEIGKALSGKRKPAPPSDPSHEQHVQRNNS